MIYAYIIYIIANEGIHKHYRFILKHTSFLPYITAEVYGAVSVLKCC